MKSSCAHKPLARGHASADVFPVNIWSRPCALFALPTIIMGCFLLAFSVPAAEPNFTDIPVLSTLPGPSQVPATVAPPPRPSGTNSMETLDDKHRLAIGDRLSFRIIEDEEDPKPLPVTDSGELEVPLIGRYPAVGKTCKQLAHELKTELEKEYYYQATVIIAVDVMTRSRGKIYVVGPVRAPGPQDIPSDEVFTLSKAILRAGGFGDFADTRNVRVTRKAPQGGGENTFTVDVGQILEKGRTDKDMPLEPGDFIYVPERAIRF